MTTITLTLGVSSDDPVSNYGFTSYDEATAGYPGAPFGALAPDTYAGHLIPYLAFGPVGDGFGFYLWMTDGATAPPPLTLGQVSFTDDAATVWTFAQADAFDPDGQAFTFGTGEVREWRWTRAEALPVVTPGNDYVVTIGAPVAALGVPNYPPIFAVCSASEAVQTILGDANGRIRLYPFGEAPQDDPHAYAVWQIISGEPENSLCCVPTLDRYGVQVDVYARTADEARAAATALRDAIESDFVRGGYVVAWNGESRDPATRAYRISFSSDWYSHRA